MVSHAIVYFGLAGLIGVALYLARTPIKRDTDPRGGKHTA